ncbi:MAG: 2-oxoglutarate dehydrogenase complex dihydrolipoyllysine-residue succinyltransferase [Gammaproteobacteria bacterium]|nr:2-oxoglutarate dehydrogenase complex dihydrolipoyllysine-residue succinyltransferase [Gammaproteobacteria bacterium]
MSMEIKAPAFPESISEGTVAVWHKNPGDSVERDELLVDIETDKVVLEVVAPVNGKLTDVVKDEGDIVLSEEVIAHFEEIAAIAALPSATTPVAQPATEEASSESAEVSASPAARKLAEENGVDISQVVGSGKSGRITKDDIAKRMLAPVAPSVPDTVPDTVPNTVAAAADPDGVESLASGERVERRVPMTRLRASIARRLVEAQHNAAMLTTFNEVDMSPVMALRKKYQDEFQARHNGTRLGFMSFFVRTSVEALKRFPSVNASIDGNDIVYHGFYDIGVAVTTERGLVVPVVRDADALSLAQIEDQISQYGVKARDGKLSIDEMTGGTFTISNGGVFGSLLSTPILNPPQTGILGMHKIQPRPMVVDGEVVVRPMMYLALSYDHRLIDGQEAVRFLIAIKGLLEDPARILLEL